MKVILATGIYPPEIGGPATYAQLMEEELRRRGWEVDVLPFRVVRHLPSGIRHLAYAWRLFCLTKTAQVILAQDTVSVGLPARLVAFFRRLPLVIRVPGDFAWEQSVQRFGVKESIDAFQKMTYGWRVESLRRLQKWVVRGATRVIAPSRYFTDLVIAWGVSPAKAQAIYNGVSLPKDLQPQAHTQPTLVSAGRLVPWKGFDLYIRLLSRLPGLHLVIIGEGPDRARLEALAAERGVQTQVEFKGALPRRELLNLIAGADLFVLGSSFESFSFQLVEAMMCGVPVIAQAIGNLGEIIQSGENGILVPPQDDEALFQAVSQLMSDPEQRRMLGKRAKETAQAFSVTATGEQLDACLHRAIDSMS